jgi:hypothetical protein
MPQVLTEVDEFFASITVPTAGDLRTAAGIELPFQKLTNRTRNLVNRIAALESGIAALESGIAALESALPSLLALTDSAGFRVSGTGTNGQQVTLAPDYDTNGNFVLAADQIIVPAAGRYLVWLAAHMSGSDATDPLELRSSLRMGTLSSFAARAWRFSAATAHVVNGFVLADLEVTTPATDYISVVAATTAGTTTFATTSQLHIRRLS